MLGILIITAAKEVCLSAFVDKDLILISWRQTAQFILDEDHELILEKNKVFKTQLENQNNNRPNWSKVG